MHWIWRIRNILWWNPWGTSSWVWTRECGHRSQFKSYELANCKSISSQWLPWTDLFQHYRQLLLLATVMYVEDTDFIHWSCQSFCSPVKLIVASQTATYEWDGLTIATGAAVKPQKCCLYFLSYWYNRGHAKLQTIWDPSIRQYCPIAPAGFANRWIYSSDTNVTCQWCVSYAWDLFLPDIWRWDTYSWDGSERIHLGQLDRIMTPSPLTCLAKCYPSTTTRHDVGSHFCHPIPPQTFRTIPKSALQVPPAPQCQLP